MIVVEHVVELPFTSVTVKTSVFAPTSEQTKAVWLKAKVAIAQLSTLADGGVWRTVRHYPEFLVTLC